MGQAQPTVRRAAGEVVASCDDDGLADVLEPLAAGPCRSGQVVPG
jgi:hydroxymethylpyrimidine pyrophosphatase-like HAD family hydrolase